MLGQLVLCHGPLSRTWRRWTNPGTVGHEHESEVGAALAVECEVCMRLHAGFSAWCKSKGNSGVVVERMGARGAKDGGVTGSYCWPCLEVMGIGRLEQ